MIGMKWKNGMWDIPEEVPDSCLVFFPAYKTVSGVNGPLVILDQVKVNTQLLMKLFEGQLAGKAGKGKTQTAGKFHRAILTRLWLLG